jgi:ATP-binding cassette subfamily C protein
MDKEKKVKKEKPKYSLISNITFVIRGICEFDARLFLWMALYDAFTALGRMVPIIFPKLIIDKLTNSGGIKEVILLALLFGASMFATNSVTRLTNNVLSIRMISARLRFIAKSGYKFMTMDFQNLENPDILDLSQKGDRAFNNNNDGVEGVMHRLQSSVGNILTLAGTVTVLSIMGPEILLVVLAVLAVNFVISGIARKKDKAENDKLAPFWRRLNYFTYMTSDFTYTKDIRLFGMKDFILGRFKDEQQNIFNGSMKIQKMWLGVRGIQALLAMLQEAALYAWLCWRVVDGAINIGSFVMYLTSIGTFASTLNGLFDDYQAFQQQSAVICDLRSFLDLPDSESGTEQPPENIQSDSAVIEFENVSFQYPGSDKYALKDVSFLIKPHEKLAVVGLNGAGKTTFIKLLMRLYTPQSGRILLNGVDIREYRRNEYFKLFSAVFQEIQTFAFTLAENISMSEYAKTDFLRAGEMLERAGMKDKLTGLEKGLDTVMLKVIDEDGVEFSGGESQKLALARALYKDAPFVVLDEPTAALDALAEERLYKEFDSLTQNKTAIYISHRLASTRFCDRVAMFEEGGIIECGTHDELIAKKGKYAELFNTQAKYYREEEKVAV